MAAEKVRLKIGSVARAVLITGQAYRDPKDALNEFVSNAADEYASAGIEGAQIRIKLRRRGRYPAVSIEDDGRGMHPDRLREVAQNLFRSVKLGDDTTLGEKAIGLLAFQQLGGRCEVVSRAEGSTETWTLRLDRGKATASLAREKRRERTSSGTTVYVGDLDPEVLRTITQRKVVEYLRVRRTAAIAAGAYEIEVQEGRNATTVAPEKPVGVRLAIAKQKTLWGTIEFSLFAVPPGGQTERVSVVGSAATTILDDIVELEEFDRPPWNSGQVSGFISFTALRQTAGRRSVLRDREAYPVFYDAVTAAEAHVDKALERINTRVAEETVDRMSSTVRKVFGKVLRELDDLENPMRTVVGTRPGEGALLAGERASRYGPAPEGSGEINDAPISLDLPTPSPPREREEESAEPMPGRRRTTKLPDLVVDPTPSTARSRFDEASGTVFYNDRHADYLLVKSNENLLLDYLATLVAKEYVVYNNPLAPSQELGEEIVRMLVRVRRLLPRLR